MTQTFQGTLGGCIRAGSNVVSVPEGLALLRPVYWIVAFLAAGIALHYGGIEVATIAAAALIGVWAFAEPRTALWLSTAFMVYVFVFFQREAPLGDELPEEFFFWGTGLALITAGLLLATVFSSQVDWRLARKRFVEPASLAMLGVLGSILAASVYGLFVGNDPFAVARQLFGCVLLPVYYFLALALLRSAADLSHWLRRASWCVTAGSLWYAVKLSLESASRGYYYREQSALVTYAGAVAAVAMCGFAEKRWNATIRSVFQVAVCVLAILFMGARAPLAGFVGAAALLLVVLIRRRGPGAMLMVATLASGIIAGGLYTGNWMLEQSGLAGDITRRFFITVSEDNSFRGRMAQMGYVIQEFEQHPVLGAGMGSVTVFFAPGIEGRVRVTSVDNGWGYVMLKMGSVGLAAFVLLLAFLFREAMRRLIEIDSRRLRAESLGLLALLFYGVVTFWGGPLFFHFTEVAFFGPALGGIVVLAEARRSTPRAPAVTESPTATA